VLTIAKMAGCDAADLRDRRVVTRESAWTPIVPPSVPSPFVAFGVAMISVCGRTTVFYFLTYTAGEVKDPSRNLPRADLRLLAVMAIYLVVNLVYLYALPMAELAATDRVAQAAATALVGPSGATLSRSRSWYRPSLQRGGDSCGLAPLVRHGGGRAVLFRAARVRASALSESAHRGGGHHDLVRRFWRSPGRTSALHVRRLYVGAVQPVRRTCAVPVAENASGGRSPICVWAIPSCRVCSWRGRCSSSATP